MPASSNPVRTANIADARVRARHSPQCLLDGSDLNKDVCKQYFVRQLLRAANLASIRGSHLLDAFPDVA